ncbi:MAG TPA: response regulator [Candidatus Acidoferrales bacterium]|nr:response regulator [Candidatus Acidoferrales bacterium]
MSAPGGESVELFLQEASDQLQFLREYSGVLLEQEPRSDELERLYIAAHTLCGTSATYGFPLFSEIAGKLAHVFQYAMNATLGDDIHGPLTEFLNDAISVLEADILEINASGKELVEDFAAFKERYSFAFQSAPRPHYTYEAAEEPAPEGAQETSEPSASYFDSLPQDGEVPDEILEFFVPEAEEHLQIVQECLLSLEANSNPEEINRLFRSIHTVKGSAAQVGLHRISAIAHRVEDLIGRLRDGELRPSAEIVDLCLESVDVLKKCLHREWDNEDFFRTTAESLIARLVEYAPAEAVLETATPLAAHEENPEEGDAAAAARSDEGEAQPAVSAKQAQAGSQPQAKSVRIALDRLDRMMNNVGELVINRTRMVGRLAELGKLVDTLSFSKERLHTKVGEFHDKHEFSRISSQQFPVPQKSQGLPADFFRRERSFLNEFSELEMDRYDDFNILSRVLTEISADVTEVLTQLTSFMGRVDGDIDEFTKLAHHLQDEITAARMLPIGNLFTRLTRAVRDAAKASNKQVDLALEGAETELDNNIIQQISDPLVHLARNAVAHGIEPSGERERAGKDTRGKISLRAYHRGNHIFIEVEDDGRGIDYERVKASAIERSLVSAETADRLTERDLREILFHPGFSTASSMTELAGRGVGLDVVRSNLNALNGEIEIRSRAGQGTCFILKVPLTLIISPALFVRCGATTFALPLAVVEEIRRIRADEIEEVGGKLLTKVRDVVTEVVRLDLHLGLQPLEPVNGYFRMVVASAAGRQIGVVVEEVVGKDEIVIKNLGEYMKKVKLFPGTTIAPDGSLILLIDLNRLSSFESAERKTLLPTAAAARVFAPGSAAVAKGSIPAEAIDQIRHEKVVVVADDSISVRKFVGRMLEKAGYRVKLATDGLDAAEQIAQSGCHLLITDLEMPRMNGYELMAQLRQSASTRRIPVLVVTSRAGAKHRDRALKEGASNFLTKPVQEDQLLAVVAQLMGTEAAHPSPMPAVPVH